MRITLTRDTFAPAWTLGVLTITYDGPLAFNGHTWVARVGAEPVPLAFGFVCEDEDRNLSRSMPLATIQARKVKAETAIPVGLYTVRRTFSHRFQTLMPLVLDVPGFGGIRIHPGRHEGHTEGCLLVGLSRDVAAGTVADSKQACAWLDARIRECEQRGEPVSLLIDRAPGAVLVAA